MKGFRLIRWFGLVALLALSLVGCASIKKAFEPAVGLTIQYQSVLTIEHIMIFNAENNLLLENWTGELRQPYFKFYTYDPGIYNVSITDSWGDTHTLQNVEVIPDGHTSVIFKSGELTIEYKRKQE
ncbi:hypothetical protein ES708_01203 [subsurface metagenome]